jgi:hypothetical protein
MRSRIGAALMVVVAVFLMSGEINALFANDHAVDYTIPAADGSLIPLVVD